MEPKKINLLEKSFGGFVFFLYICTQNNANNTTMTTTREQWRNAAQRVLYVSIFTAVSLVVGGIIEMFLSKGAIKEIIQEAGADLLGGNGSDGTKTELFFFILGLLILTTLVAQIFYALRIRQFAAVQVDDDERHLMSRASTGVYVVLAAMWIFIISPFAIKNETVGLLALLAVWIIAIVGTVMTKNAFANIRQSDTLNDRGKQGAENLRYGSVCQLRLLIMPLVYLLFTVLMIIVFRGTLRDALDGAEINATSLHQLEHSINDFGGRADSAVSSMKALYYIHVIVTSVFIFFTILWSIFSLVKPIIGWNRMMNGLTVQEGETEEDLATADNRMAALLEKVRSWLWAVVAAILTLLIVLPLYNVMNHDTDIDDEPEYEAYAEEEKDYEPASTTEDKVVLPEGTVTDYYLLKCDDPNRDDYGNYRVYATKGGEVIYTGIPIPSFFGYIVDQHDYDNDGNMDALISWSESVAYEGQQFIVSYNIFTGKFEQSEDISPRFVTEKMDGKWTFLHNESMEKTRLMFVLGNLVTIEHEAIESGPELKRYTLNSIFGDDNYELDDSKDYPIDLNDDGKNEMVHFVVGMHRFGYTIYAEYFTSGNTRFELDTDGTFVILKNKTQGWHDIMAISDFDETTYLYRWNGNGYEMVK